MCPCLFPSVRNFFTATTNKLEDNKLLGDEEEESDTNSRISQLYQQFTAQRKTKYAPYIIACFSVLGFVMFWSSSFCDSVRIGDFYISVFSVVIQWLNTPSAL